jgi:hypothetical protein
LSSWGIGEIDGFKNKDNFDENSHEDSLKMKTVGTEDKKVWENGAHSALKNLVP